MANTQFSATQAAILDQELAGIDVITGSELRRRIQNRHPPPDVNFSLAEEVFSGKHLY
jgi:5-methyltetrahydropteroyltriglutamate--homocysteine methyltransferase